MSQHLLREITRVKQQILTLGAEVEDALRQAVASLISRNTEQAKRVLSADTEIDQHEVDIEEDCLKILALHQPVAIDLRFLIAVLKINNDLERIGDLAVNIAERSLSLSLQPPIAPPFDLALMAERVQGMVHRSLDALVDMNTALARQVLADDDLIDSAHRQMYDRVKEAIRKDTSRTDELIQLLTVSRYLERVADHATNIAEDVIYLVDGQIARHRPENHVES
ncbi:MAG: phosphate signaling complex protein PhoU [candidate division Zixibacteria bacterium]|nr:phosphate signaling complex protein PhoU [candidate division Zixibacteria bacterium]